MNDQIIIDSVTEGQKQQHNRTVWASTEQEKRCIYIYLIISGLAFEFIMDVLLILNIDIIVKLLTIVILTMF